MTYYIKNGNTYKIASDDAIDIKTVLPVGNYIVQQDQYGNFFLEHIDDFKLPPKLYGDIGKTTNRIITTFHDRPMTTGVLLTGDKGSGKTMLAKNIAHTLADAGVPTIVINECWFGDAFNKLIQSIEQDCIVLFDEFEKVYDRDKQEKMLTLLDGVFSSKKLFLFTTNDVYRINEYLCNRPGRIYYTVRYEGLEEAFIREYCQDNLNNTQYIDQITKISVLFASFNFDLLKAIVEEMNRYDESPQDALKILNAIPESNSNNTFDITLTVGDVVIPTEDLSDEDWSGNPLTPYGIWIRYRGAKDADGDYEWPGIEFSPDHIQKIDAATGTFIFKNADGAVLQLTRTKPKYFKFGAY